MRTVLLAGLILLSGVAVFGQSVSTGKDIVVFRLAHGAFEIAPEALSEIDSSVENVFVNAGPYNVKTMAYRITEDEVAPFIDKLNERRAANAPAEGFSIGKENFTESDLERLARTAVVVVPVISAYESRHTQANGYTAELVVTLVFINGETSSSTSRVAVRTIGIGQTAAAAFRDAALPISRLLAYEIRKMPEFQSKAGIVEISGNTVLIELGRDNGVRVGDRFAVVKNRILPSGRVVSERTGLIILKQVRKEISFARLIYSTSPPEVGDQLRKLPRLGFESSAYFHVVAAGELFSTTYSPVYTLGTLHAMTRGLYNLRPVIGFELPIAAGSIGGSASYGGSGLPLDLYLGAELNWRLRRFDVVPLAALGIGTTLPLSAGEVFRVPVAGGLLQVRASYLVTPEIKLFVDVGFEQWMPISGTGWGGYYGGLGIAFDY